jgi:hypothetical protein
MPGPRIEKEEEGKKEPAGIPAADRNGYDEKGCPF